LRRMRSSFSSSSSTRSTPARFMPHSVVISWIRRSRSTSSCEYRRVPLGERWGSIRPRASYMRSVCGCISASSAATEIMNTPRVSSILRLATATHLDLARGPTRAAEKTLARIGAVEALGELVHGALLLLAELARDLDLHPVV